MSARWTQAEVDRIAAGRAAAPPKRSKYGNVRTAVDNISFASKLEANRYTELKLLKAANEIRFFIRQPAFDLPGGIRYVGDFLVVWPRAQFDEVKIEDTKGVRTTEYVLKRKLMLATHGIRIVEIGKIKRAPRQ